jgi:hypothetical protein
MAARRKPPAKIFFDAMKLLDIQRHSATCAQLTRAPWPAKF